MTTSVVFRGAVVRIDFIFILFSYILCVFYFAPGTLRHIILQL